ncbi:unnamed protein product [Allacma fusca]|nr:unnamed protein product [Allacma fusca]
MIEPPSPLSPLLADEVPLTGSPSMNNVIIHSSSRRSSKNSAMLSSEIIHQFILEPTLDEQKSLKLFTLEDDNNSDSSSAKTLPTTLFPQVLAAISVSLGSMIIGLISAYTSSALVSLSNSNYTEDSTLNITPDGHEASWIGSLMPLGALVGSIVGGAIVELLGRKTTLLATTLPFIVAWLLISLAQHIYMLYIARTIQGICVGVASLCLPVYLAETVQPEVRGTLGLLPTTIGNIGLLICFVAGTFLNWQNLSYLCAVLSLPFLILMFFIPETPRWYIAHGKDDKAEQALQWLRGAGTDIRAEFHMIKNTHLESKKHAAKLKDLMGKAYIKPLLTSLGLMFFQQFSGINAVIFYTVFIFDISGSALDSNVSTIIVGVVNFGATFMANVLIDRLGRKVLLLISDVLMILSLSCLAIFFYMKEHHEHITVGYGWIPLGSFMLFVIAFSLGFGPIPWLMLGEIFPGKIRGSAAAASTAFNWICAFVVTKAFPEFIANFGPYVTFLTFGAICFVGLFFIIFVVPETRGQSLEDIERNLTRPFRRLSSTANLKPSPMFM